MKVLAISSTEKEKYIQIEKSRGFTRVLTQIAKLLRINPSYYFEQEFQALRNAESYASTSINGNRIQVVVSRNRVHIIIRASQVTQRKVILLIHQHKQSIWDDQMLFRDRIANYSQIHHFLEDKYLGASECSVVPKVERESPKLGTLNPPPRFICTWEPETEQL